MKKPGNPLLWSIVLVSLALVIAVAIVERFAGELSGTILSIIASIMTPTLGALFTMLVVNPIKAIKTDATMIQKNQKALASISIKNGEKIGEVRVLVNGQMTALRDELKAAIEANKALTIEIATMHSKPVGTMLRLLLTNLLAGKIKHG